MDVLVVYPNRIVIAECKAIKAQINIEVVEKWLTKKLPAFKNWAAKQETLLNKTIEIEFWSTSNFTDEALERLTNFQVTSTKYKITFSNPRILVVLLKK
jgi:hypothetical protein